MGCWLSFPPSKVKLWFPLPFGCFFRPWHGPYHSLCFSGQRGATPESWSPLTFLQLLCYARRDFILDGLFFHSLVGFCLVQTGFKNLKKNTSILGVPVFSTRGFSSHLAHVDSGRIIIAALAVWAVGTLPNLFIVFRAVHSECPRCHNTGPSLFAKRIQHLSSSDTTTYTHNRPDKHHLSTIGWMCANGSRRVRDICTCTRTFSGPHHYPDPEAMIDAKASSKALGTYDACVAFAQEQPDSADPWAKIDATA
jgi:hypothetical protein